MRLLDALVRNAKSVAAGCGRMADARKYGATAKEDMNMTESKNSELETIRLTLSNPKCWKLNAEEARWLLKEFEYVSRTAKEMAHEAVMLRLGNTGKLADAIALLRELEWSGCVNTEILTVNTCPCCYNWKPTSGDDGFWKGRELRKGHTPDCKLAAILKASTQT